MEYGILFPNNMTPFLWVESPLTHFVTHVCVWSREAETSKKLDHLEFRYVSTMFALHILLFYFTEFLRTNFIFSPLHVTNGHSC